MTKPYHVKVAPAAYQHLQNLPIKTKRVMIKLIEALAVNPRPPGSRKMDGMTGLYCESIQHHRLIYKIEEHEVLILLVFDNRL